MNRIQKKKEFYPLYVDIMFKHIFGNTKNVRFTEFLLESLFNLENGSLKNKIKIKNSVRLDKDKIDIKDLEMDIVVELEDKSIINIEMYTTFNKSAKIKSFMYITGLFSNQLKKGEKYLNAKKITQINFVKEKNQDDELIKKYLVINSNNLNDYFVSDLLEVYIVNVEKNNKIVYNASKKFAKLVKLIGATTKEEAKEIVRGDKIMEEILDEMEDFAEESWHKGLFTKQRLVESQMEEVAIEKTEEIAKNMLNKGFTIEEISQATNLTLEEIEKIKASNN